MRSVSIEFGRSRPPREALRFHFLWTILLSCFLASSCSREQTRLVVEVSGIPLTATQLQFVVKPEDGSAWSVPTLYPSSRLGDELGRMQVVRLGMPANTGGIARLSIEAYGRGGALLGSKESSRFSYASGSDTIVRVCISDCSVVERDGGGDDGALDGGGGDARSDAASDSAVISDAASDASTWQSCPLASPMVVSPDSGASEDFGDTSIAVANDGAVHIAAYRGTDLAHLYRFQTGTAWFGGGAVLSGDVGRANTIGVDSTGKIMIGYFNATSRLPQIVLRDLVQQRDVFTTPNQTAPSGSKTAMVVPDSPLNKFWFAYSNEAAGSVGLSRGTWTNLTPVALSMGHPLTTGALALDVATNGTAHLLVRNDFGSARALEYSELSSTATGASFTPINTSTHVIEGRIAIAVDRLGQVTAGYWETVGQSIRLVDREVGLPTFGSSVSVATGGSISDGPVMRYDAAGSLHIAFPQGNSVVYAVRSPSKVITVTSTATPERPSNLSLALGLRGEVYIAYVLATSRELRMVERLCQ